MKKALLVLIAVAFMASVSFAEEPVKTVVEGTKTVVGKVLSVTVADPAKGISTSAVSVIDESGKGVNVTVTESTKILDATLNAITLNQLKSGEKVAVDTTKTDAGTEEATAIKVVQ